MNSQRAPNWCRNDLCRKRTATKQVAPKWSHRKDVIPSKWRLNGYVFLKNCKNAQWLGDLPPGLYLLNLAFSNCSKTVQNVIQMALKWLLFLKICRNCPAAGALPPGSRRGKLLSCRQCLQPTTFKIVITRFSNKQMLYRCYYYHETQFDYN